MNLNRAFLTRNTKKASDTLKHQPRGLQYLTHAHNHITLAVAAMDSCFVLVRTHQHGIAPGQVSLTITDPAVLPIRMPWEDGRAVPSQQLPHVLCGSWRLKECLLHTPWQ